MAIQFQCPQCDKTLKVADENAGKKAKCPSCQTVVQIPFATSPQEPASDNPFALDFGSERSRASSPPPAKPNQFDFNAPVKDNPYAAPKTTRAKSSASSSKSGKGPRAVSFEEVFSYAWNVWKNNLGLLVGVTLVSGIIGGVFNGLAELAPLFAQGNDPTFAFVFLAILQIVSWLVQVFVGIGISKICLQLAKTGRSDFGVMFSGGDRLLPMLGFSIVSGLALVLGLVLLIVPGILMLLFFWGAYYQVVDGRSSVFGSFSDAYQYGRLNVGTTLVIGLAGFGITIIGVLALCVGLLFAVPLVMMMWAVAYLMMSGQISSGR